MSDDVLLTEHDGGVTVLTLNRPKARNALNKALVERIQADGRVFLTGTVLRGRFVLRACVLHYGTTEADVDALTDVVRETGARLVAET